MRGKHVTSNDKTAMTVSAGQRILRIGSFTSEGSERRQRTDRYVDQGRQTSHFLYKIQAIFWAEHRVTADSTSFVAAVLASLEVLCLSGSDILVKPKSRMSEVESCSGQL